MALYFGGDPEFFITEREGGKVIPAHLLGVPQQKEGWELWYGKAFRDGFAVEFTIAPETCRAMFTNSLGSMIQEALARINNTTLDVVQDIPEKLKYHLTTKPLAEWSRKEFASIMMEAPKDLKEFGCSASYNAYLGGRTSPIPVKPEEWPFRTTGGHIHIQMLGWNWGNERVSAPAFTREVEKEWLGGKKSKARRLLSPFVKALDVLLGLPSVFLFPHEAEGQRMRRQVYGRAGEFRMQTYPGGTEAQPKLGVEYRTLGPSAYSNQLTMGFFMGLVKAVQGNQLQTWMESLPSDLSAVEDAINTFNVEAAWELYDKLAPERVEAQYYENASLCSKIILGNLRKDPEALEEFTTFSLPTYCEDAHIAWGEWVRDKRLDTKRRKVA